MQRLNALSRQPGKYISILQTQVLNRLAYPGDLALQSLTIVMFMWIFMQLWRTTYNVSGQETISGLSLNQTMWYLMIAEASMLSAPRPARIISTAVKDGSIAYLLNKPFDFMLYQLAALLGEYLMRIGFNLLAGGIIVWLMVGPPPLLRALPLVIVSMILGWLISFCLSALIGLTAFVVEEVSAFEWIYNKFLLLLGGVLIPLDFLPAALQKISLALPFAYSIYGPARLFASPSFERFWALTLGQLAWLAASGVLLLFFYRKGLKRLAINAG